MTNTTNTTNTTTNATNLTNLRTNDTMEFAMTDLTATFGLDYNYDSELYDDQRDIFDLMASDSADDSFVYMFSEGDFAFYLESREHTCDVWYVVCHKESVARVYCLDWAGIENLPFSSNK